MIASTPLYLVWLLFFAYCVIGYVVECTYCAILDGYFSNRGFLNGPYLPIYGSGAVMSLALFGGLTNPVEIFVLGGALCCALEWVTSYTMEKLYHARWWDYSHLPLNVQGRFWAGGFVEFGIGIDLVVLVVSPRLLDALERLPKTTAIVLALCTAACMLVDLAISHNGAIKMREKMDQLMAETRQHAEAIVTEARERVEDAAVEQRERVEAFANEQRAKAEALAAEQVAKTQSMVAETRERAEAFAAEQRAKSEQLEARRRALQMLVSNPEAWEQILDWELGECLRTAKGKVRELQPDLPQLPELDEVAQRFRERLGGQERRMLRAFPQLRPTNYRELAQELSRRVGRDGDEG